MAGQLGHRDRVVDVGRLAVAVGIAGGVFVGVEAEAPVHATGEDAVETLLGVALVALLQQRGHRRQVRAPVDPGQAAPAGVGVEEVLAGAPAGEQPDDQHHQQHDPAGHRGADRDVAGAGPSDQGRGDEDAAEDQGHRVGRQAPQMPPAGVAGVVGDRGGGGRLVEGRLGARRWLAGVHGGQPICKRRCIRGVGPGPSAAAGGWAKALRNGKKTRAGRRVASPSDGSVQIPNHHRVAKWDTVG